MAPRQTPTPGSHCLFFAGDVFVVRLAADQTSAQDRAYVRTTLGRAAVRRAEVVDHAETGTPLAHAEWHDIAMTRVETDVFEARIPLSEPGFFQAKSFVLPADSSEPIWPAGEDIFLHVQPAEFAAQNSLYNAFVRQFGPTRAG